MNDYFVALVRSSSSVQDFAANVKHDEHYLLCSTKFSKKRVKAKLETNTEGLKFTR